MNKYILASASPRRQQLLREVGLEFDVIVSKNVDEEKITEQLLERPNVEKQWIPETLAKAKAHDVAQQINYPATIIAADTIVLINDTILNKPKDAAEAKKMLQTISNHSHTVITGVCIYDNQKPNLFNMFIEKTEVFFKRLTESQIDFYIEKYQPFDKAGAYAIQEWIGYIGINRIEGCYYNVMGLPVSRVIEELKLE